MTKYLDNEGLTHFTGKMKEYADGKAGEVDGKVTTHVGNKQNPHGVTKAQVGLSKVINETQIPSSQKGFANGVATLDANGKVPVEQMPTTMTINGASIFGSGDLQLSASLYKIVDKLPTTGIDTSKIYLVPASATTAKNNKTEYIYLGDPNKAYDESKWEKLGDEQKSSTVTTPGGSITVDTALIENSPNPVAGGVVKAKIDEIDGKLAKKVESSDYTTKMTAIDSKLKTLENKTIDVDAELKDSVNPVQNRAVNKAVNDLNTEIGKKANDADLTTAKGRIDTLESNSISINDITLIPVTDGNGIASIEKQNKKLVITQGKFVTSLIGYVTSGTLNTTLAGYAKSETLASYYTKKEIDGKGYLTEHQSLAGYVNEVQPDKTSGNGIANITKEGKILKVTKSTFLTEHQSLADYATKTWVGEQGFAKGTIPTKTSQLTNDSGYVDAVEGSNRTNSSTKAIIGIFKEGNKLRYDIATFATPGDLLDYVKTEKLGTAIDTYASNKGYLTEDNLNKKLKETVTIKLVSDKSASDTNLNGAKVTVKSGNTTVSTQTWQGTPIKVEVPCDKEVTIEAAVVKMYAKPKVLKYAPSPLYNREVTFTYKALELGVFIIDKNDKIYKSSDEFNNAGANTNDVIGTLLVTDNVAIVVANYKSDRVSWGPNVLVDGCTVANDTTTAVKDFAGAANTAAIMKVVGSASTKTAASICYNYIFGNGRRGHLMSAGEGLAVQKNCVKISTLMSQIGIDVDHVESSRYNWTSTQISASKAYRYYFYNSSPQDDNKGNVNYVIPIYSLYD
jgi:hypothetical protein